MTHCKRLDTLEAQACRLACARLRLPPGYDVDRFLDAAIAWLQKPFDQLCAEFPMFTEAEIREIRSYVPKYRRARMLGRRSP